MNRRAQLDYPIITFLIIVVGLLIFAPIMLKILNSVRSPVASSLGNISSGGDVAQTNFNYVLSTGINFWDKVMVAALMVAVVLLFVSAFLIDVHPFWTILYIILSLFTILFAPSILESVNKIYDSSDFALESSQLTFMNWLRTYFVEFLVGVMVITGIIIYGKVSLFASGGRR